ncbi:protein translocase subunit SecD [bacterium]|nr:protein translocase subunit SecD [bacterium]
MGNKNYPWMSNINEGISLGLDLKGGIHFLLSVDSEKALQDKMDRRSDEIRMRLEDQKIAFKSVKVSSENLSIQVEVADGVDKDKFKDEVLDYYRDLRRVAVSGNIYTLKMREEEANRVKQSAIDQALETLRNRIDELGLKEPLVQKQGNNNILIQLPGYKDIQRARSIIGQTAQLEFRIVAEDKDPVGNYQGETPEGIAIHQSRGGDKEGNVFAYKSATSSDRDLLLDFLNNRVKAPEGTEFLLEEKVLATGEKSYTGYLMNRAVYLTGAMLTDARVSIDQQKNQPYVSMNFDRNGARIFGEVTDKFTKRKMAIVLDNKVNSAPVIQSKISGGQAMITLNSSGGYNAMFQEAKDLALVLRAGSLPAPVTFEENRTVGPSLGADSIQKGKMSVMIGFLLVVLFMVFWYGIAGLVADFALFLNIVFVLAGLALFGATLTFPGIAGIVLTIGMAVDANVIIFERVREELRAGKSFTVALNAGYDKAWSAIFDANLTTAIAAFVLWNFGSGPIKGFAITLLLGIISSMFTAIFVTRMIFHFLHKIGYKKFSV